MSTRYAYLAYRILFVLFIVWASARTLLHAHDLNEHVSARFIQILAGTEIFAALAFLARPLEFWSGGLLLLVFAVAAFHELMVGSFPAHLFFYSGTVLWLVYLSRATALVEQRNR